MTGNKRVVIAGLGEVGRPLLTLMSEYHETLGIDISPPERNIDEVDVLHICYPFEIKDFIGETVRYAENLRPKLIIVNSTVAIGTTRAIADRISCPVAHSPVRGKHVRMLRELRSYAKFVGGMDLDIAQQAAEHFQSVGLRTQILSSPEATELAKLTETTYFGLLITWAQEVERYCDRLGTDYDEVVSLYEEIKFLPPVKYTAGVIGGHCVMPNIDILRTFHDSVVLRAIRKSNQMKIERDLREQNVESELENTWHPEDSDELEPAGAD